MDADGAGWWSWVSLKTSRLADRLERMVTLKHASVLEPLARVVEANQWTTEYAKKGPPQRWSDSAWIDPVSALTFQV